MKKEVKKALDFLSSLDEKQGAMFQDIITELNFQILELKNERSRQFKTHSEMMHTQNQLVKFINHKNLLSEYYDSDFCK